MPVFSYGCAVFLQSDIVNFQRQGWRAEEILAGLAAVLPKNVFLYVASIPNLAQLGSRFVLQGGTQNNLAVVKAEVDFIAAKFPLRRGQARGHGSSALRRVGRHRRRSGSSPRFAMDEDTFIGLDATRNISYRSTRGEATRAISARTTATDFIDIDLRGKTESTGISERRASSAFHDHLHEYDRDERANIKAIRQPLARFNSRPNRRNRGARIVPASCPGEGPMRAWTRAGARFRCARASVA